MNELAQAIAANLLKDDPEIDARIERGIEENRKGSGVIRVLDAEGQAVPARVSLRQTAHAFHFGCNAFMLDQFQEAEKNAAYEQMFAKTFNLAVCPFYWADTEPERGKPRFAKDSPPIYRRPPADLVLEFCDRHHITPKGHPLCWHAIVPDWAPLDKQGLARETERRIVEIAEHYGHRIPIWDVCNEALNHPAYEIARRVPERHVEFAFEVATRVMPNSAVLTYNDYACWDDYGEYTPMYMLCRHIKGLPRARLNGIGLQYHQFTPNPEDMRDHAQTQLNPRYLFNLLDLYGKLNLPVNVSEITITGRAELGDGSAYQKEVTERLYRLWFSHPAMNGIIWWNLVDDTAYVRPGSDWNENQYKGGLLNYDMSPKPVYTALHRLIKEQWHTNTRIDVTPETESRFRGFYGDYQVDIETDRGRTTRTLRLAKGSINQFNFTLD